MRLQPRSALSEQMLEWNNEDFIDPRKYPEVVALIYAITRTRPDIFLNVTTLSQYLSKPLQEHWVAAKYVLHHFKGAFDYKLYYKTCSEDLKLIGYNDANWASSTHDKRSISGYCFSLTETGPLVSWRYKTQGAWRFHLVKLSILL